VFFLSYKKKKRKKGKIKIAKYLSYCLKNGLRSQLILHDKLIKQTRREKTKQNIKHNKHNE